MSKRAERRHHYQRLKEKRKREKYWGFSDEEYATKPAENLVGIAANTPHPCSCSMCGNQRHNEWATRLERLTRQEVKSEVSFNEQVDEYWVEYYEYLETRWESYEYYDHIDWDEIHWWDNYEFELEYVDEVEACYDEYYKHDSDIQDKEAQIAECWWQREDEWYDESPAYIDEDLMWDLYEAA